MKFKITFLFIVFISSFASAQLKVGTIKSDYIINIMPESKIVVEMSQAYGAKLDSSFSIKMKDYQDRVQDFRAKEKEMGELMKKVLIEELTALEQDVKQYQENGSKLMELKQNELMRPLYKKLNTAINEVAKQKGYSQVFTREGNQFAYIDEAFDITALVIEKLGIKDPQTEE
ncbi:MULTISPECIES: OmpH family outer membrane protein [unclassified Polaribacter]|uniref:OmpH family outer membrane protein n=1 Tax=unclassified Polaribacter TaxID=196858 RepID=UPI0011BF8435|nr:MULTISPECIES: OmpH family outer membrane protein [unclassified Polaribacter]TXD51179.1 OmpH family outer membrane protein [Polaribacter sp. IC063]TXD59084.1 OmpH family outer membrane protein [Polaribacter sp. IC066]